MHIWIRNSIRSLHLQKKSFLYIFLAFPAKDLDYILAKCRKGALANYASWVKISKSRHFPAVFFAHGSYNVQGVSYK